LPTIMFFSASLHPTDPNFIVAGIRDYPVSRRTVGGTWNFLAQPGDGFEWGEAEVAVSSTRPFTDWMVGSLYGLIQRTTDGGVSGQIASGGIDRTGAGFVAPVRKCPNNNDIFLTGTNRMWRTNNFFSATPPTWSVNGPEDFSPCPDCPDYPGSILA